MKNLKIGQWYTLCCHKDLRQIESKDDIEFVQSYIDIDAWFIIANTKIEALFEILKHETEDEEINEILEMIKNESIQSKERRINS